MRYENRARVGEKKRMDDRLASVAEMQAKRDQKHKRRGPGRNGKTDHMCGIRDGSTANGYQKRGRKPGRRTDFMNDPAVIAKREKALSKQPPAAE